MQALKIGAAIFLGIIAGLSFGILFTLIVLIPMEASRDDERGITTAFCVQTCLALLVPASIGAVIGWHSYRKQNPR